MNWLREYWRAARELGTADKTRLAAALVFWLLDRWQALHHRDAGGN